MGLDDATANVDDPTAEVPEWAYSCPAKPANMAPDWSRSHTGLDAAPRAMGLKFLPARLLLLAVLGLAGATALAGTTGWSYADDSSGSYVPNSGSFAEGITTSSSSPKNRYWSKITFTLDSSNVASILDYNDGGYGSNCNDAAYLTLDMTADPDSWDLEIDGYAVYSTLPDPHYDIEDNSLFGDDDETEVTSVGTVSASLYYMRSYWGDYRDGDSNDSGYILGQFAMSELGIWDYNNCTQSSLVQIENSYGDDLGGN